MKMSRDANQRKTRNSKQVKIPQSFAFKATINSGVQHALKLVNNIEKPTTACEVSCSIKQARDEMRQQGALKNTNIRNTKCVFGFFLNDHGNVNAVTGILSYEQVSIWLLLQCRFFDCSFCDIKKAGIDHSNDDFQTTALLLEISST